MREVTLAEMLSAREERAAAQAELCRSYGKAVISFTMNIAGPRKTSYGIERAFKRGLSRLRAEISPSLILYQKTEYRHTGPFAIFAVDTDAEAIKDIAVGIEEECPLGRLYDIDVISPSGEKLTRRAARSCIVCGAPGRECAAGRLHSVAELREATEDLIREHFLQLDAEAISEAARLALIEEVDTTPKPGLVDRDNSGSHRDMNYGSFITSADTLKPYFREVFLMGADGSRLKPEETFSAIRPLGICAERNMLAATGGANTHKGVIYSLGIILAAAGRLYSADAPFADFFAVAKEAARMARPFYDEDFKNPGFDTAGTRLYRERGISGIRGEVVAGFPSVLNTALPAFRSARSGGATREAAGIYALLSLIASIEDTNLYKRGGESGARFAREYAARLIKCGAPELSLVREMDRELILRNLSPGGSADLLAITYFVTKYESL